MTKAARGLSRTVLVLGVVSFFSDVSSEMIYPLLPLFLTSVLGASPFALGIIEGAAESVASLLKIVSGIWTDRLQKRKPFIVFGYSLAGIARPLVGLAASWPVVLVIRISDRIGKGIRTSPRDALIADVTPHASRGEAYGYHRAMDHMGAVVGPLIASVLIGVFGVTLQNVFLLAAIPGLIGVSLLFGIREKEATALEKPLVVKFSRALTLSSLRRDWLDLGPDFRRLVLSFFTFTLGGATDAFLLLKLSERGLPADRLAVLWSIHHAVKSFSSFYGGRLTDRMGRKPVILAAWVLYAAVYGCFSVVNSLGALVTIFILYGFHYGLLEPAERAMVSDLVPAKLRGTAFGFFFLAVGLAALPANIGFGYLWSVFGSDWAFRIAAILPIFAALILMKVRWRKTTVMN